MKPRSKAFQARTHSSEDPRLTRLTQFALALPESTREVRGSHAQFLVRKKTFAYFLDNHHGDGIVALTCKVLPVAPVVWVRPAHNCPTAVPALHTNRLCPCPAGVRPILWMRCKRESAPAARLLELMRATADLFCKARLRFSQLCLRLACWSELLAWEDSFVACQTLVGMGSTTPCSIFSLSRTSQNQPDPRRFEARPFSGLAIWCLDKRSFTR